VNESFGEIVMANLANRVSRLKASPIRDILAVASKPGMISFAGGLPARESFPSVDSLTFEQGDLQYGPSEGEQYLRQQVSIELHARGLKVSADSILILSGSQQGIDLVGKLMVEEGTEVAVESPTYLAALQVFNLFGAKYVTYDIESLGSSFKDNFPALLYSIPTFQNPSSFVYTERQRQDLASLCDDNNILLFEDDPYRDLMYERCDRQPVCSFVKNSSWIYQSTFSKTVAPGLRLGYLVCSPDLYPYLLRLKQAADLHSSRVSQRIVHRILNDSSAALRLVELQALYKGKRDRFNIVLCKYFDDLATWNLPEGGLFFWLTLKSRSLINTQSLLSDAIDSGVTFMPGEPFFTDGREASNCFRLNFSNVDNENVEVGLAKLSNIFRQAIHLKEDAIFTICEPIGAAKTAHEVL
jgi:2-aminoadipate transaminase